MMANAVLCFWVDSQALLKGRYAMLFAEDYSSFFQLQYPTI